MPLGHLLSPTRDSMDDLAHTILHRPISSGGFSIQQDTGHNNQAFTDKRFILSKPLSIEHHSTYFNTRQRSSWSSSGKPLTLPLSLTDLSTDYISRYKFPKLTERPIEYIGQSVRALPSALTIQKRISHTHTSNPRY